MNGFGPVARERPPNDSYGVQEVCSATYGRSLLLEILGISIKSLDWTNRDSLELEESRLSRTRVDKAHMPGVLHTKTVWSKCSAEIPPSCRCLGKKHSSCASPCPAVQRQSPHPPKGLLLRRGCFFQTPVFGGFRTLHANQPGVRSPRSSIPVRRAAAPGHTRLPDSLRQGGLQNIAALLQL